EKRRDEEERVAEEEAMTKMSTARRRSALCGSDHGKSHALLPYLVLALSVIGVAFFVVICCAIFTRIFRRRRRSLSPPLSLRTQDNTRDDFFIDEEHGPVVDHPICVFLELILIFPKTYQCYPASFIEKVSINFTHPLLSFSCCRRHKKMGRAPVVTRALPKNAALICLTEFREQEIMN
ncbi:hypothetical protein S83_035867, partial [Arachis hypogaea]